MLAEALERGRKRAAPGALLVSPTGTAGRSPSVPASGASTPTGAQGKLVPVRKNTFKVSSRLSRMSRERKKDDALIADDLSPLRSVHSHYSCSPWPSQDFQDVQHYWDFDGRAEEALNADFDDFGFLCSFLFDLFHSSASKGVEFARGTHTRG